MNREQVLHVYCTENDSLSEYPFIMNIVYIIGISNSESRNEDIIGNINECMNVRMGKNI